MTNANTANLPGKTSQKTTDPFVIKPLASSFDIREMRQLIAQWRMENLSDSQILKMQLLFFGEPAWMNLDKVYDCTRFSQIVKGMRLKNQTCLIELVIKCKGFGLIWRKKQMPPSPANLIGFYSPIWHQPKKLQKMTEQEKLQMEQEKQQELQRSDPYYLVKDIYNKKKNIKKKNSDNVIGRSAAVAMTQNMAQTRGTQTQLTAHTQQLTAHTQQLTAHTQQLTAHTQQLTAHTQQLTAPTSARATAEREQLVRTTAARLLQAIATNDDAYASILQPINEQTQQRLPGLFCDPKEAHPLNLATRQFLNNHLYPYIVAHGDKLMAIRSVEGMSCWVKNLVRLDFMQKNIQRAINETQTYLALHAEEMRRQYRPISPHEYQDQKTGQRFYDTLDPKTQGVKACKIPDQAQPRPSDRAQWNKFAGKWKES